MKSRRYGRKHNAGGNAQGLGKANLMLNAVPSGETRIFPVIGDPIDQVKSPGSITPILFARGKNALVVPLHVDAVDMGALVEAMRRVNNIDGMLVTVPHKFAALSFCSSATERARFAGSTNVMRKTKSGWHGDNTDGMGYLDGVAREGFEIKDKRALLIGCGGAGSAIAFEILNRGARELAVHDIDAVRRDDILKRLADRFPGRVQTGSDDPSGFDFIANATPMGMRLDDPFPVDVTKLVSTQFVACVITKPEVPSLIAEARSRGCMTMTGKGMFDAQAETLADFLLGQGLSDEVLQKTNASFVS
ncbi:shikimate dehydrogenase [Mesorhizobium sp. SB112]|uniref:shikimate dehydrogenase family protein n=1 Tax=Mesorhizobium sp. SB112 TaxID=3151853 RepID=UPI0032665BE4